MAKKTKKKECKPRVKVYRPDGCLSPNEAGRKLGITGEAVKRWVYHGRLPASKSRNGYLVAPRWILRFFKIYTGSTSGVCPE